MTKERVDTRIGIYDLALFLVVFLMLGVGRWDTLVYPFPLNPDEAQMAANALRIREFGLSWDALDGTTSGPLNSLLLCWPYLAGGDVTFSTARLTAIFALGIVVAIVYASIACIRGRFIATLLTLTLATFYALTRSSDFLQYASEIPSICLLVFANYLAVWLYQHAEGAEPRRHVIVALGAAIGAVPFAKLQALPIAVVEFGFCLFVLADAKWPNRRGRLIDFLLSLLLPAAIFLGPLLLLGNFRHFINSYVLASLIHLQKGADGIDGRALLGQILDDPILMGLLYTLGAAGIFSVLYRCRSRKDVHEHALVLTIYAALLILSAIAAILIPGKGFFHYLNFLPPFLVLLVGYWAFSSGREPRYKLVFGSSYAIAVAIVGVVILRSEFDVKRTFHAYYFKYRTTLEGTFVWNAPRTMRWFSGRSDRLLVWGWMPQWYVWSGLPPASRESITQMQIQPSVLRDYYRHRMTDDLSRSQPDFIVDANAGAGFGVTDWFGPDSRVSSNPELASLLRTDFQQLDDGHRGKNECPKLYVRRQRLAESRKSLVEFSRISASSRMPSDGDLYSEANIVDNQVTEDACVDYWLLPDEQLGAVKLDFVGREAVRRVLIMNTSNGFKLDRMTRRIRLELLDGGKTAYSTELDLRPHPEWTEVVLDRPASADALRIDILSYVGAGAGLNEVKVIRASPNSAEPTVTGVALLQ